MERQLGDLLREEADSMPLSPGPLDRVLRRARVRRLLTATGTGVVVIALVGGTIAAAGLLQSPRDAQPPGSGGPATEVAPPQTDGCPVTVPPDPGFVPPEPYPPQPPEVEDAVWYGSAELWTMIRRGGSVWEEFPEGSGKFEDRTFWWSESFSVATERKPAIVVTGRRLDGRGAFAAGDVPTNGFQDGMGSFMLVGVEIPAAGCWELTARYKGAELSYVVEVGSG